MWGGIDFQKGVKRLSSWGRWSPREMKAGMSDDAELFIKAEEGPVSLIDQGRSQNSTTHAVITHKYTQMVQF